MMTLLISLSSPALHDAPRARRPRSKLTDWLGTWFNPAALVTNALTNGLGPYRLASTSGLQSLNVQPEGALGGGQIGYNWQRDALVLGLEADVDWSGMRASTSAPFSVTGAVREPNISGNVGLQQKLDYFGTVRGRLGWANDTLLIYGTGGGAWGHVNTTFDTFNVASSATPPVLPLSAARLSSLQVGASSSNIRFGFVVGGGLEYKLAQNWSVKAEGLFIDFVGA
jgi:outer membrane immunogenic protein